MENNIEKNVVVVNEKIEGQTYKFTYSIKKGEYEEVNFICNVETDMIQIEPGKVNKITDYISSYYCEKFKLDQIRVNEKGKIDLIFVM